MEIIKFNLSGLGASFTRPSFNSVISTYSHIHKISLLGILGAIIGIDKTSYTNTKYSLPPFYKELKDLKIGIVPKETLFPNNFTTITCTNGFANKSSNFVQNYELLINPSWDIYIYKNENKYYEKIKEYLLNKNAYFIPYLGRNHWYADINNVEILNGDFVNECEYINGLFKETDIEIEDEDDDFDFDLEKEDIYFKEYMPTKFKEKGFIQYIEEPLVITNRKVISCRKPILNCDNKNIYLI